MNNQVVNILTASIRQRYWHYNESAECLDVIRKFSSHEIVSSHIRLIIHFKSLKGTV